jgi:thiol-disulfide isomerase/thioredoxin
MAIVAAACSGGTADRDRTSTTKQESKPQRAESAKEGAGSPLQATDLGPLLGPVAGDGLVEADGPELFAQMRASGRKATLLSVWASWCGSCKYELPMLVSLSSALESEGIGVMFVSVDTPEARAAAVQFLDKLSPRPQSYVVRGGLGPFKQAVNPKWKGALPATGLYDAKGELLWFWPSTVFEHEITAIVTQFLAGQPLEGEVIPEPDPPSAH